MNNIPRLIVRENSKLWFGFSDTEQFKSSNFTEKDIKIKRLEDTIKAQEKELDIIIQDWKELKTECDFQTKELRATSQVVQLLLDKIKLMGEMNNELQSENLRLKTNSKCYIVGCDPIDTTSPYYIFCTNSSGNPKYN